jgi:hypothetical protein
LVSPSADISTGNLAIPVTDHTSYLTSQGCEGPEDAVTLTRIRALPTAA